MAQADFIFLDPGPLIDHDLELVLVNKVAAQPEKNYVPAYEFILNNRTTGETMGHIHLRVGDETNENLYYGGNIGYEVQETFRGKHYASRACKLLFPLAKQHGINPLFVTCDPDNTPSRKTCELADGILVEIVELPEYNDQYASGARERCRYRFDL